MVLFLLFFREYAFGVHPENFLNMQTYTFSQSLNVKEAIDAVQNLDLVMFNEFYDDGLLKLSKILELDFPMKQFHYKGESENSITNDEIIDGYYQSIDVLKQKLIPDYKFYNECLNLFNK